MIEEHAAVTVDTITESRTLSKRFHFVVNRKAQQILNEVIVEALLAMLLQRNYRWKIASQQNWQQKDFNGFFYVFLGRPFLQHFLATKNRIFAQ